MDPQLKQRIEALRRERGDAYEPRTRHLDADGWAKFTNRLFLETSPYLLQHAHNPVDWYPWGDEAFETARRLKRPVLLSVGYSTCHWCHVMEEESFEDEEIAQVINANYIAVKVDREERPDVDAVYMAAVQALTGGGGWPMTVWLTPDRKPFYGGTYFPARDGDRGAGVGFLTILQKLKESYDLRQDIIAKTSHQLVDAVQKMLSPTAGRQVPGEELLNSAFQSYRDRFDAVHGGLSGAPKFPSTLPIRFLLRYFHRTRDGEALRMAVTTLEKIAAGGMYDHVGGGFHRYATDARWLVPHFEKMLYDNALLVLDYLEAYQVTGNAAFERTVHEVLAYIQRDMTSPEGAFYSATDADSLTPDGDREEGYFFTWTPQELQQALGDDLVAVVNAYYVDGPFPNFEGRFILHASESRKNAAAQLSMDTAEFDRALAAAKAILLEARSRRPAPLRDEKVLTAWNGLMISAFARAGLVLDHSSYLRRAEDAADFVLAHLLVDGRLLRSYKDGRGRHNAFLEDYAFFTAACIDLFEATHKLKWLQAALALDQTLADHYEDDVGGGFFATSDDHETMIAREKPNYDGATPAGNSVAVMNLLRLGALTSNPAFRKRAEKAMLSMGAVLKTQPTALAELLTALDFYHAEPLEILLVVPQGRIDLAATFLAKFRQRFLPNRVLVVLQEDGGRGAVETLLPMARSRTPLNGRATVYVCRNNTCTLPTDDPDEFAAQIGR